LIRKPFKYVIILSCFGFLIFLAQVIYFDHISAKTPVLKEADLIVVFPGAPERIAAGFLLAREGYAPHLAITGKNVKSLKYYAGKYGLPSTVRPVGNCTTRTTFEDALCARNVVKQHGFGSIILVTSSYHIPRAYFLLRVLTSGMDVKIHLYGITRDDAGAGNRLQSGAGTKMVYNEMVKFWVSIFEMLGYKVTGNLLAKRAGALSFVKRIRSWILFEIPH
jgi:uncharacterized SAM-binding protein YcdF (DUF218 family)